MFQFKIINKQSLGPDIKRLDIQAPEIARRVKPGHFVIVTPQEGAERIPLTVVEADLNRGLITLIFQEVGATTRQLGMLQINETVFGMLGPLGVPSVIEKLGTVVCITTGVGTAQILPICRAHKKTGNKVIGIIGAKAKKLLTLEAQMRLSCNNLFIATNDGSYMKRGLATDLFRELLNKEKIDLVHAVGSVDMMHSVVAMTRERKIKTRVSLNPVMIDGTGMCGSCRVKVNRKTVLACVDGPEFDGHQVDFEDLKVRMNAFQVLYDKDGKEIECFNQKSTPSRAESESKTLTRFLSGILKSKP